MSDEFEFPEKVMTTIEGPTVVFCVDARDPEAMEKIAEQGPEALRAANAQIDNQLAASEEVIRRADFPDFFRWALAKYHPTLTPFCSAEFKAQALLEARVERLEELAAEHKAKELAAEHEAKDL